jgi:hypothetical protein
VSPVNDVVEVPYSTQLVAAKSPYPLPDVVQLTVAEVD